MSTKLQPRGSVASQRGLTDDFLAEKYTNDRAEIASCEGSGGQTFGLSLWVLCMNPELPGSSMSFWTEHLIMQPAVSVVLLVSFV